MNCYDRVYTSQIAIISTLRHILAKLNIAEGMSWMCKYNTILSGIIVLFTLRIPTNINVSY